jgi:hypothetical protein
MCNDRYIAFVDSDTFFTTRVDREDLFENGKHIIIGLIGGAKSGHWYHIPLTSQWILDGKQYPEPMRCMSYWPVIIMKKHFLEMRKYVESAHSNPFREIYREYVSSAKQLRKRTRACAHYNVMCSNLWYFQSESYVYPVYIYICYFVSMPYLMSFEISPAARVHTAERAPTPPRVDL